MKDILKTIGIAAIGAIIAIVLMSAFSGDVKENEFRGGAAGNRKAESYIPYVQYNGGYNSAKDIKTSAILTGGTLAITSTSVFTGAVTLSGTLDVSGATTLDELTQGGSVLATSTVSTAMVFTASDLLTNSIWEVTPNVADLTYTFPASSTLSALVPSAGDSRTWTIVNATTTAAIDVIFAAGTGSAIKGSCGGGLTLDEASHGTLTLARKANSDLVINTCFPTAD